MRTGTGACPYKRTDLLTVADPLGREAGERTDGGGLGFHGVIHSLKAIKTAMDTNLQKATRSPFPCRHRRSLQ